MVMYRATYIATNNKMTSEAGQPATDVGRKALALWSPHFTPHTFDITSIIYEYTTFTGLLMSTRDF